jgi:hypothetical protein
MGALAQPCNVSGGTDGRRRIPSAPRRAAAGYPLLTGAPGYGGHKGTCRRHSLQQAGAGGSCW